MSFREGHYFSLENSHNNSNSSANKSDYQSFDFSEIPAKRLAELWRETLENGMHGICFSLYEDGQKPGDIITAEQVNHIPNGFVHFHV
jgi:glucan 1,3-beta-glucosidase